MKLEPVITEKSSALAADGRYTFRVARSMTKHQIRKLIEEVFDVHVKRIWTMNQAGEVKKTMGGQKKIIQPSKKTIVQLAEKEKIDLFDTKK